MVYSGNDLRASLLALDLLRLSFLRIEIWQLQCDIWRIGRGHDVDALAVPHGCRNPGWRRNQFDHKKILKELFKNNEGRGNKSAPFLLPRGYHRTEISLYQTSLPCFFRMTE